MRPLPPFGRVRCLGTHHRVRRQSGRLAAVPILGSGQATQRVGTALR